MLAPCKEGIPETVLHGIPSARPLDESAPKRLGNGGPNGRPFSAVVIGEVERRRLADTGGLRLPSSLCTKMLHGVPRGTAGADGGGAARHLISCHRLAARHLNRPLFLTS